MLEKELCDYLKSKSNLYIYGAGVVGKRLLRFCNAKEISVKGYVVSEEPKEKMVLGKDVLTLEELHAIGVANSNLDIVVAIGIRTREDRLYWNDFLSNKEFRSALVLLQSSLEMLKNWEDNIINKEILEQIARENFTFVLPDMHNTNEEKHHLYLKDRMTDEVFCRCVHRELLSHKDVYNQLCSSKIFAEKFFSVKLVPFGENAPKGIFDSYVFLSHFDTATCDEIIQDDYIPLQVAAALTDERKGCQVDCEGDHISHKNPDYSECTGIYWIYKNTKGQEYVGLSHYRRRLLLDEISQKYIVDEGIDVVLPVPTFCGDCIEDFFQIFIQSYDWITFKKCVKQYDESYAEIFEIYEKGHFFFHANLALWKREWFDRYCEFVFAITSMVEEEYAKQGIQRHNRFMGYLVENLTSLYVLIHRDELHVACTQMKWLGEK